jgi:two-component sensor histidine kinase
LDRVLVFTPYRSDALYLSRLLTEHEISVDVCSEAADIERWLSTFPGVLVVTLEALSPPVISAIAAHLCSQPAWSELPIVVLVDKTSPNVRVRSKLGQAWLRSRQLFYQRPLSSVEILSGIQSALLARHRQRDVRDNIDREIELRRELNHRVKNILASVISIFDMTKRGARTIEGLAEDFSGRLGALEKVHSAVFRSEGDVVSISEIVALTFEPYRGKGRARIQAKGPPVVLTREAGTTLALCLHELATNAIKYGALSNDQGRVSFSWSVVNGTKPLLEIKWLESGGPAVFEPARLGYGTRYLRFALTSLFGTPPQIEYMLDGLSCKAAGPFERFIGNP